MADKLSRIVRSRRFPLLAYLAVLLAYFLIQPVGWGDDPYFANALSESGGLIPTIISRYTSWTSRILIETVLVFIIKVPLAWRILNAILMMWIVATSSELCDKSPMSTRIAIALCLSVPFSIYNTAGWITTTVNYVWSLALGLYALTGLKRAVEGKQIQWYRWLGYSLALLFAANFEQMAAILFAVYGAFFIYMYINNRKVNVFLLVQFLLVVASLIFILTCPGNAVRKVSETNYWFPDFAGLSLLKKLEMGFSSTLYEYIIDSNILFSLFSFILCVAVFTKYKNQLLRFVSLLPVTICVVFGLFQSAFAKIFPFITTIKKSLTQLGTNINWKHPTTWIPDLLFLSVAIMVLVCIYAVFNGSKQGWLVIFILLCGFGSRMLMSFSPTIWASGDRTFLQMNTCIIICAIYLMKEIKQYSNSAEKTQYVVLGAAAISSMGLFIKF